MSEDKSPGLKTSDGVISLEDLDNIINQVDPGFNESLESIKKEAVTDTASIEALQIDSQVDVGVDEETGKISVGRKILNILLSPFVKIKGWLRLRWMALSNRTRLFKDQSIQFIKHEVPERLRYCKSLLIAGLHWLSAQVKSFLGLTRGQKIATLVISIMVIAGLFFIGQTIKGKWLPAWHNPIMGTFADHADFNRQVKDPKDYIEYFQAFPEIEIPFLLTKIIINLAPSPGSKNPMGAFEFYLGLDAKETAIEVKDREKEILDLVQRTVEEFNYEEVTSQVGQVRMKARVRDSINTILNQGRVTKVYISTMVTNH